VSSIILFELIQFIIFSNLGIGPTDFVKSLPFEKTTAQRLVIDDCLRVKGQPDIYALGDCAGSAPLTAQVAQQQAKYVVKTLNNIPKGLEPKPFQYNHLFSLAYVGGYKALADSKDHAWRGFGAFLLWRGAYLTKTVSFQNKMLIVMYWIKSFLFGRDISRF